MALNDKFTRKLRGNRSVRILAQAGLLLALAVVVRNFSYMVYFAGATGMRITISGIFTKITAILFGPFLGGISSGLLDLIGYLIKPEGAYIPLLTITAVLGGLLTGFFWLIFRNIDIRRLHIFSLVIFILIGLAGVINHIYMAFLPESGWAVFLETLGSKKVFTSIGMEAAAAIGLLFLLADLLVSKLHKSFTIKEDFLKILISTGISGIIVTTLNTEVLRIFIPSLSNIGFAVFLVPRLIQEVIMILVQTYIISILLAAYKKFVK
ncbi:MAG: folate family ECF transporter S component [Eubacteriales bacterium]|nr:folate family ECF transporter S component [Eubacteriales bacterium]